MAEGRHEGAHLAVGGNLIDEAEPGAHTRDIDRAVEVPDGVQVFR